MGWMSAICDAYKKKVGIELLYISVHRMFRPVGEKMLEWGTCPREAGPPGHQLSSPGEWERNAVMAIRVGVNVLQFCSVSNSLSHTTFLIKWEVYFSKELCCSSLLCRRYDSVYRCICIMGLYNNNSRNLSYWNSLTITKLNINQFKIF